MASHSNLPRAVRKQARVAERAHNKAYKSAEPPPGAPVPPGAASANVTDLALATPPEAADAAPTPDEITGGQPVPVAGAPTPIPASVPVPADSGAPEPVVSEQPAPSAPSAPTEDWEQKYRTLQGMMDREAREMKTLRREIDGLQSTIAAITSVQTPASAAEGPGNAQDPSPAQRRLRQEDVDAYGDEMIKVIKDAAFDELRPVIDDLRKENTKLRETLGGVEQRTAQSSDDNVVAFMDRQVPNWREVNEDQGFLDWLNEADALTGVVRQDILNDAGKNYDAPRIAAFFKAYLNENQAIRGHQEATPPAQQASTPAPASGPTVDMTSLVAPGRPAAVSEGAGAAADSEDTQVYTQAQITAFYRDVQKGVYRDRPKDKDRLEKAIHKAAMTGRVRA